MSLTKVIEKALVLDGHEYRILRINNQVFHLTLKLQSTTKSPNFWSPYPERVLEIVSPTEEIDLFEAKALVLDSASGYSTTHQAEMDAILSLQRLKNCFWNAASTASFNHFAISQWQKYAKINWKLFRDGEQIFL